MVKYKVKSHGADRKKMTQSTESSLRIADTKWRRDISQSYKAMQHIVPLLEESKRLTQCKILKGIDRYIQFLERVLYVLLNKKAQHCKIEKSHQRSWVFHQFNHIKDQFYISECNQHHSHNKVTASGVIRRRRMATAESSAAHPQHDEDMLSVPTVGQFSDELDEIDAVMVSNEALSAFLHSDRTAADLDSDQSLNASLWNVLEIDDQDLHVSDSNSQRECSDVTETEIESSQTSSVYPPSCSSMCSCMSVPCSCSDSQPDTDDIHTSNEQIQTRPVKYERLTPKCKTPTNKSIKVVHATRHTSHPASPKSSSSKTGDQSVPVCTKSTPKTRRSLSKAFMPAAEKDVGDDHTVPMTRHESKQLLASTTTATKHSPAHSTRKQHKIFKPHHAAKENKLLSPEMRSLMRELDISPLPDSSYDLSRDVSSGSTRNIYTDTATDAMSKRSSVQAPFHNGTGSHGN